MACSSSPRFCSAWRSVCGCASGGCFVPKILDVQPWGARRWKVFADDDCVYVAESVFLASLAEEFRKAGTDVIIGSSGGWYYRNLYALKENDPRPAKRICSWCRPPHVMSEGSLPATHGMCAKATAELDAQMSKKYGDLDHV